MLFASSPSLRRGGTKSKLIRVRHEFDTSPRLGPHETDTKLDTSAELPMNKRRLCEVPSKCEPWCRSDKAHTQPRRTQSLRLTGAAPPAIRCKIRPRDAHGCPERQMRVFADSQSDFPASSADFGRLQPSLVKLGMHPGRSLQHMAPCCFSLVDVDQFFGTNRAIFGQPSSPIILARYSYAWRMHRRCGVRERLVHLSSLSHPIQGSFAVPACSSICRALSGRLG